MIYIVLGIICTVSLYIIWAAIKEKEMIKELEHRQDQFAIEQYNRNRPAKLHVKTIEELQKKMKKDEKRIP